MPGKLLIFSAPSGSGKTTIVKHLLQKFSNLEFSVSACSRPKREREVDGKDYYFISPNDFRKKISDGQFIEWEEVYPGSYYGTLKSELERIWAKGNHVVFDVDVKGGLNLKKIFNEDALAVFIMPPSIDILRQRLEGRGSETPESIEKRVGKAAEEMEYAPQFDVTIINNEIHQAFIDAEITVQNFISKR